MRCVCSIVATYGRPPDGGCILESVFIGSPETLKGGEFGTDSTSAIRGRCLSVEELPIDSCRIWFLEPLLCSELKQLPMLIA
jgi:hypothetical protein